MRAFNWTKRQRSLKPNRRLAATRPSHDGCQIPLVKSAHEGPQAGRKSTAEEDGKRREEEILVEREEEDRTGRRQQFQIGVFHRIFSLAQDMFRFASLWLMGEAGSWSLTWDDGK